jgi:hypothetical protein
MEETKEQKKEGPGGIGREKPADEGAEAGGRAKGILYVCFNDGAGNYVDPSWKWFTCWRCGSTGYC